MPHFVDAFNRADGSLGANWTLQPGASALTIFGNQVRAAGFGSGRGAYYSRAGIAPDQYSQVQVLILPGTTPLGAVVRSIRTGSVLNAYLGGSGGSASFGDNKARIMKWVAGTLSSLAVHATQVVAANDILKLVVLGTALELFVNGVSLVTVTDASLTDGAPGMYVETSGTDIVYFDNWQGGDETSASLDDPDYSQLPPSRL